MRQDAAVDHVSALHHQLVCLCGIDVTAVDSHKTVGGSCSDEVLSVMQVWWQVGDLGSEGGNSRVT